MKNKFKVILDYIKRHKTIIVIICINILIISTCCYAATSDPTLIKKLNTALNNVKKWLVKLATPAAAVAVCTGVMFKKFSFGDEERMRLGDKVIRSSIVSYIVILSVDMILKIAEGFVN